MLKVEDLRKTLDVVSAATERASSSTMSGVTVPAGKYVTLEFDFKRGRWIQTGEVKEISTAVNWQTRRCTCNQFEGVHASWCE